MPVLLRPLLLLLALSAPSLAPAQGLGLSLPRAGDTLSRVQTLVPDAQDALAAPQALTGELTRLRQERLRALLRRHRDLLDTDPLGAVVVRSEVVAIDPSPQALDLARTLGYAVAGERRMQELDLRLLVLRAPSALDTRAALRQLRQADPGGSYDFNHLYTDSGSVLPALAAATAATSASGTAGALRVGLVDSGVDRTHPALAGIDLQTWGCDGRAVPDRHGTAVASLLAGTTAPAAARLDLYAADIYCGRPTGGAVTGLAEALAWLARERVGVINLSLVGPPNALLERAVRALAGRGHVLVAAVGNDGPAAPPLYPAAYPEVIGVTAVNAKRRALPEAERGPQVDFAALGAELRAAVPGGGWGTVRGTSFAAPLVARLAAADLPEPDPARARQLRERLAAQAIDLGRNGRDDTYGYGFIGGDTAAVAARRP